MLEAIATALLPVRVGDTEAITDATAFRDSSNGAEYLAIVFGGPAAAIEEPVLTRVHSGCVTGDILGSMRCDCGPQLEYSLREIATLGHGVVVYAPSHEGRGIGLANKIRAYALQDDGLDTVDANTALGFEVDHREFNDVATILRLLGVTSIRLMTNNPMKAACLIGNGIEVEQAPMPAFANPFNAGYIATKRDRLGHGAGHAARDAAAATVDLERFLRS